LLSTSVETPFFIGASAHIGLLPLSSRPSLQRIGTGRSRRQAVRDRTLGGYAQVSTHGQGWLAFQGSSAQLPILRPVLEPPLYAAAHGRSASGLPWLFTYARMLTFLPTLVPV
jgi:hypothetical protein